MKFLLLSDIHGAVAALDKLDEEFRSVDAVLFAGDFAQFDHLDTGLPVLEKLCSKHEVIYSVIGNCDDPSFLSNIEEKDISVEHALVFHDGLAFAGSGGGSKFTGTTPNERTDEELLGDLEIVSNSEDPGEGGWNNLIVIMHNPPKDTKCDAVAPTVHVGSPLLRKFIEEKKPLAVLTGHIHEACAIDKIGDTVVVNPGSLADGKYAVMEVGKVNDAWSVLSVELKNL